jgi:hypothetical protein
MHRIASERAGHRSGIPDVCFGSLADIEARPRHVRFTPEMGIPRPDAKVIQ